MSTLSLIEKYNKFHTDYRHRLSEQKGSQNNILDRRGVTVRDLADKITYAFQLATAQGPLCQEPVQGIAVVLEDLGVHVEDESSLDFGRLTGEAIRIVRESISQGFLDWSPRIMLAMYSCEIQASSEFLSTIFSSFSLSPLER